jgi:DNA-binding NtrC family response regulator
VGGDKDIKVNVRILAATNKDINAEIKNGNFREDLYHRLSVILIHVPSLNERTEDIPLLADHFLDTIAQEQGSQRKKLSKDAYEALKAVNWTGNIRELRNLIERLIILCDDEITGEDVRRYANPGK